MSGEYSSSSDDDEWTRPSLRTDDQEGSNNNQNDGIDKQGDNHENKEHDPNEGTGNGEKKMVDYSWNEDEKALAGNDVVIQFIIHDASATTSLEPMQFVMGVTIGHLKTFLEDNYRYP